MRASTCNEALCCALRSALCLGQPLARGVDVQLMRRSALQRLASESLLWGSKLSEACRLHASSQSYGGWDECCAAATTAIQQSLAWQLGLPKLANPARTQIK